MRLYLEQFSFPDAEREYDVVFSEKRTCYSSFYPFGVLSAKGWERVDFKPITIFYGGNGSGKSTALNVISEKLGAQRGAAFNHSAFYERYLRLCALKRGEEPNEIRFLASDDVFDSMLGIRELNDGMDARRGEIFEDYLRQKHRTDFRLRSMEDYDELRQINRARRATQSEFTRQEIGMNLRTFSNGESAFRLFTESIGENSLYLLDEPENSLSPARQQELAAFLVDSARFFSCQFVLATHSPFFLAIRGAKIYDLDENPVGVKRWTELESIRTYYEFFKAHSGELEEE